MGKTTAKSISGRMDKHNMTLVLWELPSQGMKATQLHTAPRKPLLFYKRKKPEAKENDWTVVSIYIKVQSRKTDFHEH